MTVPYDSPDLDRILEALANERRRGIVHELSLQPASISQLARSFGLTLPAIHKHIRILEEAQLIVRRKEGRTNFVALNYGTLRLVQQWVNQYQTGWGNTNASFENYLSGMQE